MVVKYKILYGGQAKLINEVNNYISELYKTFKISISDKEYSDDESDTDINSIGVYDNYDEIKLTGIQKLLGYLKINDNDVFYDLGSGVVRLLIQVSILYNIKKLVGVEYFDWRHGPAAKILKNIKLKFPEIKDNLNKINLINDNLLNIDIDDATIIYTASVSDDADNENSVIKQLESKIKSNKNIRYVISLHKLNLNFKNIVEVKADADWSNAIYHIYSNENL